MVNVVVAVLAVSAHAVEVVDAVQPFPQHVHILIGIEVGGIGLFDLFHVGIKNHVGAVDQAHLYHFGNGKFGKLLF